VLAKVGSEKDGGNIPSQMSFSIDFLDRKRLKQLKDLVIDAQVILQSMASYANGIRVQAERYCKSRHLASGIDCDCIFILDELDLHIAEVELHSKRTSMLNDRAEATGKLVSFGIKTL
jgi:hypothetical protein